MKADKIERGDKTLIMKERFSGRSFIILYGNDSRIRKSFRENQGVDNIVF